MRVHYHWLGEQRHQPSTWRLVEQRRLEHAPEPLFVAVNELLATATSLGEPPNIVGKAEVDQINIISRWIHRHSDDRAFFPFQHALSDEQQAQLLSQRIWDEVNAVRTMPIVLDKDDFDDI